MDSLATSEWPDELLPSSDDHQCRLTLAYDAGVVQRERLVTDRLMWAPARANHGCDAGITAQAPSAGPAGCWPAGVSRNAAASIGQGFYIAACAPSNANEIRRDRPLEVGRIGATCSRSHQMFMNTTRKCTGTFSPGARGSCKSHDNQKL
jgi:hypothetical protein